MSHNRRESSTRLKGSSPPGGLWTRKVKADRLASTSYCTMRFSVPGLIDRRSQQVDSDIIGLESWSTAEAQYRGRVAVQPCRPEELVETVFHVHANARKGNNNDRRCKSTRIQPICCRVWGSERSNEDRVGRRRKDDSAGGEETAAEMQDLPARESIKHPLHVDMRCP